MSTCHKMNYSSVPNKRNKRSPLLFFLDKIFGSPFPLSCSYQDTPLQTYKLTHTPLINFSFFFEKKSEKWGSNFQMKCVISGYSSCIDLHSLFFHSVHAGFLWIYTIWIKLGKWHLPSCLFYFAEFSNPILLLR